MPAGRPPLRLGVLTANSIYKPGQENKGSCPGLDSCAGSTFPWPRSHSQHEILDCLRLDIHRLLPFVLRTFHFPHQAIRSQLLILQHHHMVKDDQEARRIHVLSSHIMITIFTWVDVRTGVPILVGVDIFDHVFLRLNKRKINDNLLYSFPITSQGQKSQVQSAKDELSTNEPTWKQISNLND